MFKVNISHKGKTIKFDEVDNEELIDKHIGDKISGSEINAELAGYDLEITGTSDKAGFPGLKEHKGPGLKKVLLTRGKGMWDNRKGVRLRKTIRGDTISADTVQINTNVLKEGTKKFETFAKKEEKSEEKAE
ncbi:MAG: S6e family ribosomal protein [Nanoarchaeota archaeon]|nr:S6e family ribosomal protein [Nanoarchaeota archaeon]